MTTRARWHVLRRWQWTLFSLVSLLALATMLVSLLALPTRTNAHASVQAAPAQASPRSAAVRQLCSQVSDQVLASAPMASSGTEETIRRASDAFQRCLTAHDTAPSGQDAHWLALKNAHRIGRNGVVMPANQVQPLVS